MVLVAMGLASCGRSPDKTAATAPVVRLGALFALTGNNARAGQHMAQAMQMAVREANDGGGVLGHKIELDNIDDACDPGAAVVGANELVSKDITVSVGGGCSLSTVPTLKVFRDAGIPMIIPAANSTDLLTPRYDSVFLLAGTTSIEGQRAVTAMGTLGTHRLVLVEDGTTFSRTLADATMASAGHSNISVATRLRLSQGAAGYPTVAQAALQQQADTVFYTGNYPEAGKLIRDLKAGGYTGQILLSDGGMQPGLFTMLDAAQAEGVYGLMLPQAQFEPRAGAWSARYKAAYGQEPGPFAMQSYDAVRLALNAIQRAGSLDRTAIRKAIATTSSGDIQLLSGPSEFNADGTQVNPTFFLAQIHNGAFALAHPVG